MLNAGQIVTAAGDFDGNGRDDFVFQRVGTFELTRDVDLTSTSAPQSTIATYAQFGGFSPIVFAAYLHDLNGDGFDDLVVPVQQFIGPSTVQVVYGTAGAVANPVVLATVTGKLGSIAFGDFDGNGEEDFAIIDAPFGGPATLRAYGQNQGVFSSLYSQSLPNGGRHEAGDFDGDGLDDIVLAYAGNTAEVLRGSATGPTAGIPISMVTDDRELLVADLNEDGRDDIVVSFFSTSAPWEAEVVFGDAVATLVQGPVLVGPGLLGGVRPAVQIQDFDVDGHLDVVCSMEMPDQVLMVRGDGAGGFSPVETLAAIPYGFGSYLDMDADGDLDFLTRSNFGFERIENRSIYGAACLGTAGAPSLSVGAARPGTMFEISLGGAAPNAPVQLLISTSEASANCVHVDLGALLYPAATGPFFAGLTDASGSGVDRFALPMGLPSGPYYAQALVLDPQGALQLPGVRLATSNGRAVRVF